MKTRALILAAVILCACNNNQDKPEDVSSAGDASNVPSAQTRSESGTDSAGSSMRGDGLSSQSVDTTYMHVITALGASPYGGKCTVKGTLTNGGKTALTDLTLAYQVHHRSADDDEGTVRAVKTLSTDPAYGDLALKPGETRQFDVSVANVDCDRISSIELLAFMCGAENKDANCTTESLSVDDRVGVIAAP